MFTKTENAFLEIYFPSAKKIKFPSHQVFCVFALEVNEILQATPPKLRREMEMYGTAAIMLYSSNIMVEYSYGYSSLV